MQHMYGNIPYLFDYWATLFLHLLLLGKELHDQVPTYYNNGALHCELTSFVHCRRREKKVLKAKAEKYCGCVQPEIV